MPSPSAERRPPNPTRKAAWPFLAVALALALAGCDLAGKSEDERPIILHLSLDDSLTSYDSVHIALTQVANPDAELELVHRGYLTRPSQVPAYTLKVAKDPFLVKVLGFRKIYGLEPREQLAMATYIIYEGGKKRVERPLLPPLAPFNRRSRLVAAPGILEPAFHPDIAAYTLKVPRGAPALTLQILAEYDNAVVTLGGEVVAPNAPSRTLAAPARDSLVTVTVTDLGKPRNYQVLLSPEKAPALALDSLWHSAGVLTPAFDPDSTAYQLVLPAAIASVDFKLWPEDPANTVMTYQSSTVFPGAQRTVYVDAPGRSVAAVFTLARGGASREYRFNVSRSP